MSELVMDGFDTAASEIAALELLRGLTATFCLGLPSDGGLRSSWMVAPCVRPRLLKMFFSFLREKRGSERGR